MPSLGADMEAGTLSRWQVKPGDRVKSGDVVAVIETDKGAIEVEVFATGTIERLVVGEGEKVPVGTVLAVIQDGTPPPRAEPAPPTATPTTPAPPSAPEAVPPPAAAVPGPPTPGVRASPAARHRARELDVPLARVTGTGPHGEIVRADVERAAAVAAPSPPPAPAPDAAAAMRRAIAAAMARSNREIPHYYLALDVDLRRPLAWLGERNAARPIAARVLPAALLLHAIARTLPRFPELNGAWADDAFRPAPAVNLAVAIALRVGGLVTPCIHGTDALDLDATMAALSDLVIRARASRLRASELTDGTATVTNLGDLGVDGVFGVIYPPQVALVGIGRVVERPVAVDGMLAVHPVVRVSLAGDHRASDGHRGGLFLAAVDQLLQEIR